MNNDNSNINTDNKNINNNNNDNDNDPELTESVHTPDELLKSTMETVEAILAKSFPDHLSFGNGAYTISRGSTQIMIMVLSYTENETCIECLSQVVTGANVNDELMRFLLRKNAELHFGSFGLLFDDTITFSHSIAGTHLDESEFMTTINSVAVIADHYDDVIVEMAGGKRAADLVEDLEA